MAASNNTQHGKNGHRDGYADSRTARWNDVSTQSISVSGDRFTYRELGPKTGVPVIFLNHLAGELDRWDPAVVDGIAAQHRVIVFNNRGVASSEGRIPDTIQAMARDAIAFIRALGFEKVDLFGFSLGGFVVQDMALQAPELIRRIMMAGTGPAGGQGMGSVLSTALLDTMKASFRRVHPEYLLFFTRTDNGQKAAAAFIQRVDRRQERDKPVSLRGFLTQIKAIKAWANQQPQDLSKIEHPVWVANGDQDKMVPTVNTHDLARRLPNSKLTIYEDAGHGGIFQYHEDFVNKALDFLA